MSSIKISVIIPVYNEEKAVGKVVAQITRLFSSLPELFEIIVVDDGSTDKTQAILKKLEKIKLICNPYNLGYGASLKRGIKAAEGTHILIIDSDGTYPVDAIPPLVKKAHSYDMAVGSRTGKNVKIPLLRRPAKKILNILANFVSGHKIPDLNSGLRIFRKDLALEFFHLYPQKFSFTTTITLAFLANGHTICFLPINYYKRQGKSTIHPIKDFFGFMNIVLKIFIYFNPFKLFFYISSFLFLLSIALFLYTFFYVGKIMDVAIMVLFLSALQIFLFGIIADLLIKRRD